MNKECRVRDEFVMMGPPRESASGTEPGCERPEARRVLCNAHDVRHWLLLFPHLQPSTSIFYPHPFGSE